MPPELYERLLDIVENHAQLAGLVALIDERLRRVERRSDQESQRDERRAQDRIAQRSAWVRDIVKIVLAAIAGGIVSRLIHP